MTSADEVERRRLMERVMRDVRREELVEKFGVAIGRLRDAKFKRKELIDDVVILWDDLEKLL